MVGEQSVILVFYAEVHFFLRQFFDFLHRGAKTRFEKYPKNQFSCIKWIYYEYA